MVLMVMGEVKADNATHLGEGRDSTADVDTVIYMLINAAHNHPSLRIRVGGM